MPRRVTLTDRQREALLHLPVDQGELLRHYTLSDEDLGHIRQRRRAHNRFGFALQLCVLRYPGRVLAPGELIPAQVSDFIAAQLGLTSDDLLLYAAREETRHEHLADLRRIYGYRSFSGRGARDLREWIAREAEAATSNEDLARRFVAECRRTRTILPGSSTIERLCADALVEAERIEIGGWIDIGSGATLAGSVALSRMSIFDSPAQAASCKLPATSDQRPATSDHRPATS